MSKICLHWFRKDLRLHDNPALINVCAESKHVIPVFFIDKWHRNERNIGNVRFRFLLESLCVFDRNLKEAGVSCGLLVLEGEPEKLLPIL
eukprot:Pgem_evm1s16732